ncbi:MAG: CRISPR-associated protein Cas4 [Clostridium sulfidigenes]|uniref:CRISPR-associated exonuclease Cas4 n=1 Tax=Clostridium sulfidigenes TaxID=318464 RepID=A0A927W5Q0_9CLOT|nr:CRISPR-associated protein Cas4 [Clostridium sulfidigenes]
MKVNGTLINYYFHCKRQCWLHGNRLNLEDNSEVVKIGKAIHEEKAEQGKNTELTIDNVKIDKLTNEYLVEVKKSDADIEASKWQLLLYLKVLKGKGIDRKGKLEFVEKNKSKNKILYVQLDEESEIKLDNVVKSIEDLINMEEIPSAINKPTCKKCAYYEYCYI